MYVVAVLRRLAPVVLTSLLLLTAACGDDGGSGEKVIEASDSSTADPTTTAKPTTTTTTSTTTSTTVITGAASTAALPSGVLGVSIGVTEAEIRAAFGAPDEETTGEDLQGNTVRTLTYDVAGGRVQINFRGADAFTDYRVVESGPKTEEGIGVGSSKAEAEAEYGDAQPFVIEGFSQIVVKDGTGNELLILIDEVGKVTSLFGGDPDAYRAGFAT